MNKDWKFIPGFEGKYLVSSAGEVFSLSTFKFIKPWMRPDGYGIYKLVSGKFSKTLSAHRLVAELFLPKEVGKNIVNHKDCNRQNNSIDNLEWCTPAENVAYSKSLNRYPKGEKVNFSKLTERQVLEIRSKFSPYKYTIKQLSKEYGVCLVTINQIIHRNTWKHI